MLHTIQPYGSKMLPFKSMKGHNSTKWVVIIPPHASKHQQRFAIEGLTKLFAMYSVIRSSD